MDTELPVKTGISTNRNVSARAVQLKAAGIDFVFRYYSQTTHQLEKRLTRAEAEALCAAGLEVGVVYEDAPTVIAYFSGSRGHQDGVNAFNAGLALHQPAGSAIYFAVDYDATLADLSGSILDYFKGIDKGIGDAAAGMSAYVIGVYGSGASCDFIKTRCPFVRYAWLAESKGWLGSKTYASWDVNQTVAVAPLCSLAASDYESNDALDDFGGFVLPFFAAIPTAT